MIVATGAGQLVVRAGESRKFTGNSEAELRMALSNISDPPKAMTRMIYVAEDDHGW